MEKKRILIAEDEAIAALQLKLTCEKYGFHVIDVVTKGETVIDTALTQQPDMILMDIYLADNINGIEAVKKIHSIHKIPVIFITASEDETTYEHAQETIFISFISKPYNAKKLMKIIDNYFNNK